MPLSKERNRERMRLLRSCVQPNSVANVQPKFDPFPEFVQPNRYLAAHIRAYPEYEALRRAGTYDPMKDPYINSSIRLENEDVRLKSVR